MSERDKPSRTYLDPITGLRITVPEEPEPEFWVVSNEPGASGALVAYCTKPTKAQALEYQLANGLRASTHIEELYT